MPRENTEKLLNMIMEGMANTDILIEDLLNFLDDREVGEFMAQYGYEVNEDEEPEYPQDEIDAEEEHEAYKSDDWYAAHGLDPLGDIEFEDSEDT